MMVLVPSRGFHYINYEKGDLATFYFIIFVPLRGFHYINLNKYEYWNEVFDFRPLAGISLY